MKYLRPMRAWLVGSLLTALLLVTVAAAANGGHEFSGYFDVSGVSEQGDLVQVTLHVKLFNHMDADAKSVIVALMSPPVSSFVGNFQPVRLWKSQHFIEMSQQFSISKTEFRDWFRGPGQPDLVILFQDNKGHSWRKGVQVARWPLVQHNEER